MKNASILLFLALISISLISCCDTNDSPFPAEDCFIRYDLDGISYFEDSIEFVNGIEAGILIISHTFENGGSLSIISHDWDGGESEAEASFLIYSQDGSLYSLKNGVINITEKKKRVFKGTFTDGDSFITNSEFVLRYGVL